MREPIDLCLLLSPFNNFNNLPTLMGQIVSSPSFELDTRKDEVNARLMNSLQASRAQ